MKTAAHRVVTLVSRYPSAFEIATACEVFGIDRPELVDPWYSHELCAERPGLQEREAGWPQISIDHGLDQLATADTVMIAGWAFASDPPSQVVLDAVRSAYDRGARLLSVCTGAFVLAEAGLLEGRRATTHWAHVAEFAERYPAVDLDPDVLYVDDGQILTSAGTAAGIDLCLHVVRCDHGAEVANAVARRMVVPPHREGGQAQYVDHPMPDCCDELGPVLAWALEHLHEEMTVTGLARRAAMSERTFARRFRASTGTSPLQWILHQRVLLAQRLLEHSDEPIELVATRSGLGSAANLRLHFSRLTGASPQAYRRTFRGREAGMRA